MLNVFFTVDVELWCDGWDDIDSKFPSAFRQYIYGPTPKGDFGLPFQLAVLAEHGLSGTFFVETLFSARFGEQPLEEIVSLIGGGDQEVQLHLHPEWVDEAKEALLPNVTSKRQHLFHYSLKEQQSLIGTSAAMLRKAGVRDVTAFRAGSFGFNRDTLKALARNGIAFDSSYNATMFGPQSGVLSGVTLVEPMKCEGVIEYPMTVFHDGMGLRHVQLTACSTREMEGLLWQALEHERSSFVILSHCFELLNASRTRPDDVVVKRFRRLCAFLDRNRDVFRTCRFEGLSSEPRRKQPALLKSPYWRTGARMLEQVYRRRYQ